MSCLETQSSGIVFSFELDILSNSFPRTLAF